VTEGDVPAWPAGATPIAEGSPLRGVLAAVRARVRADHPDHADHRLELSSWNDPGSGDARLSIRCLVCDVRLEPPESSSP
jgi:hypothetical protein